MNEDLAADRIVVLGGGRMGSAMIAGLVTAGFARARISVVEPDTERLRALQAMYGVGAADGDFARAAVVVVAVKPKHARGVLAGLRDHLGDTTVLLSVVAGLRIQAIEAASGCARVVRAIPNTPAEVGRSATVWLASPAVSAAHRSLVRELLRSFGTALEVESESDVEVATGVVGPAPALVDAFVESFTDAAVRLGLPRQEALALIVQSVRGSIDLLERSGAHPVELRDQVTSPGGATAAGLLALDRAGFRTAIHDAVEAVYRRSLELGED